MPPRGASKSSPKSCTKPVAKNGEQRGSPHPARGGGLPSDRAPRGRWVRRSRRPHPRCPRRSPGRARGTARLPRRRRRDRDHRRHEQRRRARIRRAFSGRRARLPRPRRRAARPAPRARDRLRQLRSGGTRRQLVGRAVEADTRAVTRIDDKILLRKYHEEGDLTAREKLIEQYMSLVRSLARRYSYRGEQLEDLVQIGAIGLIKAIDRFDLTRGVELTTYATPNIIGEIKRHFRDKGWAVRVPRGLQELNVQLSKLIEQLTVQLGRSPTIPELSKAAGVDEEDVLEALESGRAYSSLSLSTGGGSEDGEELDPLESLGDIEHQYEVSEDRAVLAPGFKVLDPRERHILHLRFFEGLTQSQIAQHVGISQMHVSRLIRRALEKIRAEIAADELDPDRAA